MSIVRLRKRSLSRSVTTSPDGGIRIAPLLGTSRRAQCKDRHSTVVVRLSELSELAADIATVEFLFDPDRVARRLKLQVIEIMRANR